MNLRIYLTNSDCDWPLRHDAQADNAVFASRKGGVAMTTMQEDRIVKVAADRAGLPPETSAHWLWHCQPSHSLDRGAPLHRCRTPLIMLPSPRRAATCMRCQMTARPNILGCKLPAVRLRLSEGPVVSAHSAGPTTVPTSGQPNQRGETPQGRQAWQRPEPLHRRTQAWR